MRNDVYKHVYSNILRMQETKKRERERERREKKKIVLDFSCVIKQENQHEIFYNV